MKRIPRYLENDMSKLKNIWIRTDFGWAGRKGFITKSEPGNRLKYVYKDYLLEEETFSDSIGDLKSMADAVVAE